MRTRLLFLLIFIPFMAVVLTGCTPSAEKKAAEELVHRYFKYLEAEDFNRVFSLYSAEFTSRQDPELLFEGMKGLHESLGAMKSYKLEETYISDTKEYGGGTTINLLYIVRYENRSTEEKFSIFLPKEDSGGRAKIIRLNIRTHK